MKREGNHGGRIICVLCVTFCVSLHAVRSTGFGDFCENTSNETTCGPYHCQTYLFCSGYGDYAACSDDTDEHDTEGTPGQDLRCQKYSFCGDAMSQEGNTNCSDNEDDMHEHNGTDDTSDQDLFKELVDSAETTILSQKDHEQRCKTALKLLSATLKHVTMYTLTPVETVSSQAQRLTRALNALERVGPIVASTLAVGEVVTRQLSNLELMCTKTHRHVPNLNIQFSQGSSVDLSPRNSLNTITAGEKNASVNTTAVNVCSAILTDTGNLVYELMPEEEKSPEQMVNTHVMMLTLRIGGVSERKLRLSQNVSLTLKMNRTEGVSQPVCVSFYAETMIPTVSGCHGQLLNSTHVRCLCSHLTSFAAIMTVVEVIDTDPVLELLSVVCLSLSVLALLLAVLTFLSFRKLHTERYFSLTNLSFSLGLAQALYLFGIDQVSNQVACKVIAGFLHFLFLSAFCWMGVEGLQVYLKLVIVFEFPSGDTRPIFALVGYGIPATIVAITTSIDSSAYGTVTSCWLSKDHFFHLAFVVPAFVIIAWNTVVFSSALVVMNRQLHNLQNQGKEDHLHRKQMKGTGSLLVLLGVTWIFGAFQFHDAWSHVFGYLFVIFNGTQGVFIYVFHCLINKEARTEYYLALHRSQVWPQRCKKPLLGCLGKDLEITSIKSTHGTSFGHKLSLKPKSQAPQLVHAFSVPEGAQREGTPVPLQDDPIPPLPEIEEETNDLMSACGKEQMDDHNQPEGRETTVVDNSPAGSMSACGKEQMDDHNQPEGRETTVVDNSPAGSDDSGLDFSKSRSATQQHSSAGN